MKNFYSFNKYLQWFIAIVMTVILLSILHFWLENLEGLFLNILFIFIFVPIYSFLFTPLMTLTNIFKYKSPMLLVLVDSKKNYALHSGTSFDYLVKMGNVKSGVTFQNKVLEYHLEGILKIIKEVEDEVISDSTIIKGSSYFFSESTAKKLGFKIAPTNNFERLVIIFNYLEIMWMLSRTKGKLSFPKINNFKTVQTTGKELLEHKPFIENLFLKLKKRNG